MSDQARTGMPWPLALGGAVLLFVLLSLRLFVLPAVDEPEVVLDAPADAVVVLGGGQGERLSAALGVLRRLPGDPPALVLSVPFDEPLLTCGSVPGEPAAEVRCLVPEPATTAGEAAAVASLAAEQQWQRMVVVTSDYHVTRARVLVTRCVEELAPELEVLWIAGDTAATSLRGAGAIATEWPSLLGTPWDHEPACSGEAGLVSPLVGTTLRRFEISRTWTPRASVRAGVPAQTAQRTALGARSIPPPAASCVKRRAGDGDRSLPAGHSWLRCRSIQM